MYGRNYPWKSAGKGNCLRPRSGLNDGHRKRDMGTFQEKPAAISGENICVDGGMTGFMIYSGEHSREYQDWNY